MCDIVVLTLMNKTRFIVAKVHIKIIVKVIESEFLSTALCLLTLMVMQQRVGEMVLQ